MAMAICSLCGKELRESEEVFVFPAFVPNTKDPLYQFNDSAFHIECLKRHPLGDEAIRLANQFIVRTRPANRICKAGGNVIQKPDDYIFFDLLTSDQHEDLYEFNFTTLDKGNLGKWEDRSRFVTIATKFRDEGKWGDGSTYRYLDSLIKRIIE
jgi:hypothetical protein